MTVFVNFYSRCSENFNLQAPDSVSSDCSYIKRKEEVSVHVQPKFIEIVTAGSVT
jgi:hypothetical protein